MGYIVIFKRLAGIPNVAVLVRPMVPFSMDIRNWELMHECSPKHSRMGTARMEKKETEDEGKKPNLRTILQFQFRILVFLER